MKVTTIGIDLAKNVIQVQGSIRKVKLCCEDNYGGLR
jgi:hypothetical protein